MIAVNQNTTQQSFKQSKNRQKILKTKQTKIVSKQIISNKKNIHVHAEKRTIQKVGGQTNILK
jgi:hypothetical protein